MRQITEYTNVVQINTVFLLLIAGVVLGFYMPDRLSVNRTAVQTPIMSSSAAAAEYADCLWYVARNHGFYHVQREAASRRSSVSNTQLWNQFVDSTGALECGVSVVPKHELLRALNKSSAHADQYFLGVN